MSENREGFGSRLGFILVAAGCAIGLGNVWRFPFITGQYGGAAFILIYLLFLLIFGFPILVMEFTVGRAAQRGVGRAFNVLEKPGHKWHYAGIPMIVGNYLLMMFYTTVTGWMLYYFYRMVTMGDLMGMNPEQVGAAFGEMLGNGPLLCFWMIVATFLGLSIVALGVKRGVEGVTKIMMVALLFIMLLLVVRVLTLPGAGEGLEFYLKPDFAKLKEAGIGKVVFAALGQSFFTLSIGIGSMTIFGSYIGKTHSLPKEAANICLLDTVVALLAGLFCDAPERVCADARGPYLRCCVLPVPLVCGALYARCRVREHHCLLDRCPRGGTLEGGEVQFCCDYTAIAALRAWVQRAFGLRAFRCGQLRARPGRLPRVQHALAAGCTRVCAFL